MEVLNAHLPELVQSRIEDLVNVQTVDEEMATHMKELGARLGSLEALTRTESADEARQLVEDVERLIDRIRRDYVAIAYRQGVVDGAGFKKLVAQDAPPAGI